MTHTPTPWKAWTQGLETKVKSDTGLSLMTCHGISATENAAFIVRACNAHDELVAALQGALEYLEANGRAKAGTYCGDRIIAARAALAKVTA